MAGLHCKNEGNDACVVAWEFVWDTLRRTVVVYVLLTIVSLLLALRPESIPSIEDNKFTRMLKKRLPLDFLKVLLISVPSVVSIVFFVHRSVTRQVQFVTLVLETVLVVLFASVLLVQWLGTAKRVRFLFSVSVVFDVLSVVSHFVLFDDCAVGTNEWVVGARCVAEEPGTTFFARTWMTLSFMRAFHAADFLHLPERMLCKRWAQASIAWKVVLLFVNSVAALFIGASIMMLLEQLGEPTVFVRESAYRLFDCDGAITDDINQADDCSEILSMLSGMYFILTTSTTIGYGDFSPSTTMGRLFVIAFMVIGVVAFGITLNQLQAAIEVNRFGRGSFDSSIHTHIVVTGTPSLAQLVEFIREVSHPDHGAKPVSVVCFLSSPTEAIVTYLASDAPKNVVYIEGSPFDRTDLKRAAVRSADAVFILPDKFSTRPIEEDSLTLLTVMSINKHLNEANMKGRSPPCHTRAARFILDFKFGRPRKHNLRTLASRTTSIMSLKDEEASKVRIHVMLRLARNKEHALAVGIPMRRIVAIDELNYSILGTNTAHIGLATMVGNMVATRSNDYQPGDPAWTAEYKLGASKEVYSIRLGEACHNRSFQTIALSVFEATEGRVMALGFDVQREDKKPVLAPTNSMRYRPKSRLYVLASDESSLDALSDLKLDTHASFQMSTPFHHHRPNGTTFTANARIHRPLPVLGRRSAVDGMLYELAKLKSLQEPAAPSRKFLITGGHVAVLCNAGVSYEALEYYVRPLRKTFFPRPIVILHPNPPTAHDWAALTAFTFVHRWPALPVFYVRGSPLLYSDVSRAGVQTASKIVLLAEAVSTDLDSRQVDAQLVFVLKLLRSKLGIHAPPIIASLSEPLTAEFVRMELAELPDEELVRPRVGKAIRDRLDEFDQGNDMRRRLRTLSPHPLGRKRAKKKPGFEFVTHPGHVCGLIYATSVAESLLAGAYFEDHCISVIKRMVVGHTNAFELVNVPTYMTHAAPGSPSKFAEVFRLLLTRYQFLPLGILRFGAAFQSQPYNPFRADLPAPKPKPAPHGDSIAGLLPSRPVLPYVYTSPEPDAMVMPEDLVVVLIHHENSYANATAVLQRWYRGWQRRRARQQGGAVPLFQPELLQASVRSPAAGAGVGAGSGTSAGVFGGAATSGADGAGTHRDGDGAGGDDSSREQPATNGADSDAAGSKATDRRSGVSESKASGRDSPVDPQMVTPTPSRGGGDSDTPSASPMSTPMIHVVEDALHQARESQRNLHAPCGTSPGSESGQSARASPSHHSPRNPTGGTGARAGAGTGLSLPGFTTTSTSRRSVQHPTLKPPSLPFSSRRAGSPGLELT